MSKIVVTMNDNNTAKAMVWDDEEFRFRLGTFYHHTEEQGVVDGWYCRPDLMIGFREFEVLAMVAKRLGAGETDFTIDTNEVETVDATPQRRTRRKKTDDA